MYIWWWHAASYSLLFCWCTINPILYTKFTVYTCIYPKMHLDQWPISGPEYRDNRLSWEVFLELSQRSPSPGGSSHWHGIRICACLLRCLFAKFGIAMGGSSTETKEPKFKNWVYFEQIIVKSTQFEQNWVLFYWKWYTNGWVIGRKIGIEKVRFSRFGRHIHVRFWWK